MQSFGSPNKTQVGVFLQRGALLLLLCFFPCWALLLNTQHILPLLRQDLYMSRYHLAPAGKPGKEPRKKPPCRPRKQSEARGSFSLGLGIPPRSVVLQL